MVFLSQPILKPHFPIVYRIICCVFSKFSAVCVVSFSIEIALKEGKKGQVIFMQKKEGSLEKNVYRYIIHVNDDALYTYRCIEKTKSVQLNIYIYIY